MATLLMLLVISLLQQRTYWETKLSKICGRDEKLKEAYGIIITQVTQRSPNRSYYLEPRLKTNCKENELLRSDSTKWSIWISFNSINFFIYFLMCYRFFIKLIYFYSTSHSEPRHILRILEKRFALTARLINTWTSVSAWDQCPLWKCCLIIIKAIR